MKGKEIKYDRAPQLFAFPITIFGSCIFAAATIINNIFVFISLTITGLLFILTGFIMVWAKEIENEKIKKENEI